MEGCLLIEGRGRVSRWFAGERAFPASPNRYRPTLHLRSVSARETSSCCKTCTALEDTWSTCDNNDQRPLHYLAATAYLDTLHLTCISSIFCTLDTRSLGLARLHSNSAQSGVAISASTEEILRGPFSSLDVGASCNSPALFYRLHLRLRLSRQNIIFVGDFDLRDIHSATLSSPSLALTRRTPFANP